MALLEIRNLTKRFHNLIAVNNVSFHVDKNELFGLIGPNGSGKTVLINTISGVYQNDGGEIIFNGENISNLPPYIITQKGITRTFQGSKAFLGLTVFENVRIGKHCRTRSNAGGAIIRTSGTLKEEKRTEEEAMRILEQIGLGLPEAKDTPVRDLTFVMRSLLGIAIALAAEPTILLLDEPLAGMNSTEITNSMNLIRKMRNTGITIFLIEHNMKAIMGICERIMVLNHGDMLVVGTPQEISQNEEVIQAYLGRGYLAKNQQD